MKRRNLSPVVLTIVACAAFKGGSLDSSARAADRDAAPAISGTVRAEDGKPIPRATVAIHTAGTRVGTNPYCPSCYADCGKRATSDAVGAFSIKSLDPALVFRVLLVAKGYEPKFVKVDPLKDKSLEVTLKSRPKPPDDPQRILAGQVVGPRGKPLVGAIVEPFGCKIGERRWWGSMPGVDPLAVTDEQGQFQIVAAEPVDGLDLEISARAFAKKRFALVPSGKVVNRLPLSEGATVRGRVVDHGRPVAGVNVGLAQVDRNVETFLGPAVIGTDADGQFLFANVSGNDDYFVYGIMSSLGERGGISERRVHVGGDGSELKLGDFAVEPAFRLSGRLVLADGKPLPDHTRVLVSRSEVWDSQIVEVDAKGAFVAGGIPRGVIHITASVPGYRLSAKNKSLDRFRGFWLQGLVEKDVEPLVVLFEPGKVERSDWPRKPAAQKALGGTFRNPRSKFDRDRDGQTAIHLLKRS
jgi:Carboxypeptidase regulatory-like domain